MTQGEPSGVTAAVSADDIRPLVGRDISNRPLWIAITGILIAGILLFSALQARQYARSAPAVRPDASDLAATQAHTQPFLYIPPAPIRLERPQQYQLQPVHRARVEPNLQNVAPFRGAETGTQPQFNPTSANPLPAQLPSPTSSTPAVVFDVSEQDSETPKTSGSSGAALTNRTATAVPAKAARSVNLPTIVPQGTLIAAVLETALDSTQPGQARALVSRDVANIRGRSSLIPRGSRLFGEYSGTLEAGQKRAHVQWTRLVRPDGVSIAIDSPAADRLGRAGIGGRVNTHFLERLGGALLQSSFDIGAAVASRSVSNSSVIVALPGNAQGASSQLIGPAPKPTLKIRQGTQISVFVVRDLDFTSVETGK